MTDRWILRADNNATVLGEFESLDSVQAAVFRYLQGPHYAEFDNVDGHITHKE